MYFYECIEPEGRGIRSIRTNVASSLTGEMTLISFLITTEHRNLLIYMPNTLLIKYCNIWASPVLCDTKVFFFFISNALKALDRKRYHPRKKWTIRTFIFLSSWNRKSTTYNL